MGFQQVPVPEDRLQEVYTLLARGGDGEEPDRAYDLRMMERLWAESGEVVRKVLQHFMCHPGEWIPTSDLVEAAEVKDGRTLGGHFAPLRKRCLSRYGKDLPWEVDERGDDNYYRMSVQNAALVDHVY